MNDTRKPATVRSDALRTLADAGIRTMARASAFAALAVMWWNPPDGSMLPAVILTVCCVCWAGWGMFSDLSAILLFHDRLAASERRAANTVELARWVSTDPMFSVTGRDRETASEMRRTLDAGRPDDIPTLHRLETLLERMSTTGGLMTVFRQFGRLTAQNPRLWREMDAAYRETMRRVTMGEPLQGMRVMVPVAEGRVLVVEDLDKEREV